MAPDFRIGWTAAGRFHDAIARLKAVSSMAESALLSETLAEFLASGGYDHHLRTLRRRYAANLDERGAEVPLLSRRAPATLPRGGFVFSVDPGGVIPADV